MILIEKATFDVYKRDDKGKIIKTIPLFGEVEINEVIENTKVKQISKEQKETYLKYYNFINKEKITLENLNINLHFKEL